MITFKGWPDKPGLYHGYTVLLNGQEIGFIYPGGSFSRNHPGLTSDTNKQLTTEDRLIVERMCGRVQQMPSEWGCLGVGQ